MMTARLATLLLAVVLLAAGCVGTDTRRLEADKDLLEARRHAEIAAQPPPCARPEPVCRQAQEIRAEACRSLAAADAARRREHLACAVAAYRAALEGEAAPRRAPLLNLATAANDAITAGAGDPGSAAEAELLAADGLLRTAGPADAEGCYYAGSARLARALLQSPGPGRCAELGAVPAACAAAAPPAGREAQGRALARQLSDQRRGSGCP